MAVPLLFFNLIILMITSGNYYCQAHVVMPYDSSFTHKCLTTPYEPQYGGGIAVNAENGLKEQRILLRRSIKIRESKDGNKYFAASTFQNHTSALQRFHLEPENLYAFSAWVQVSEGDAYVEAVFKTPTINVTAGWVPARNGCWSMLKGGVVVNLANSSETAELFFRSEGISSSTEIWVDSISLQPFTDKEWKSHQQQSVNKIRKTKVKFQVVDNQDRPVPNAKLSINQTKPYFPFGNAITEHILTNKAYKDWFTSRFRYTVLENEMKWYYTEKTRGSINYTIPDLMFNLAKSHDIAVRGHTVLWEAKEGQPEWLQNFPLNQSSDEFRALNDERVRSVMNRYKGQVVHWDVVNENMHHHFITERLVNESNSRYYNMAHEIDPDTPLFVNEYMTIERSADEPASPWKYIQKIWELRDGGYNGPLSIGLQGHFNRMNLPYIRASIDMLASMDLPIWITELDVSNNTVTGITRASYLEQIIREVHSHEAVEGILMWAAITPGVGCWRMCLTDDNFKNLLTGDVVDKIIGEWRHEGGVHAITDGVGVFETWLFHGEYEATVSGKTMQPFKVVRKEAEEVVVFKICV